MESPEDPARKSCRNTQEVPAAFSVREHSRDPRSSTELESPEMPGESNEPIGLMSPECARRDSEALRFPRAPEDSRRDHRARKVSKARGVSKLRRKSSAKTLRSRPKVGVSSSEEGLSDIMDSNAEIGTTDQKISKFQGSLTEKKAPGTLKGFKGRRIRPRNGSMIPGSSNERSDSRSPMESQVRRNVSDGMDFATRKGSKGQSRSESPRDSKDWRGPESQGLKPCPSFTEDSWQQRSAERVKELVRSQNSPAPSEHRADNDCDWKSLSVAILVLVVVLVVATFISRSVRPYPRAQQSQANICGAEACVHSVWLTSGLNYSVDPCDDFGGHVCSAWKPTTQLISWNIQHDPKYLWMTNKSKYLLRKLFSAEWMTYVAEVYYSCVNRTGEDQRGALVEFVSFLNNHILRNQYGLNDVNPLAVALELSIRWQMPFWFHVRLLEETASRRRSIYFSPSRYLTFWKSTYREFNDEHTYHKYTADYRRIFSQYHVSNVNYSETEFSVAANIMTSIYSASFRRPKNPAVLSLNNLEGLLPAGKGDNWKDLLNKNFKPTPELGDHDKVLVSDTEILEVLKRLLGTHGSQHMLNQLAWWFVQAYTVVASDDAFVVKYGEKSKAAAMKPMFCETQLEEAFKLPLLIDHVLSNFNSRDRIAVDTLLESVILAAITKMKECEWMDAHSREVAITKLNTMSVNLWPRRDIDTELFTLAAERRKKLSYIKHWIRDHEHSASQLGTAVYYENMRMPHNFRDESFQYDYILNNLTLAMLALEKPFYDRRGTLAFRYGALGSVFARKVVMSFDIRGINHLPSGARRFWLSQDSKGRFIQKATCDGGGFEESIFPEIPGLEVAFRAFQDASRSPADSLQNLPSLEHKKDFFLTFCHVMCVLDTKAFGDGCNLVLKNFRPFAETFQCPLGSRMNPTKKCRFF